VYENAVLWFMCIVLHICAMIMGLRSPWYSV